MTEPNTYKIMDEILSKKTEDYTEKILAQFLTEDYDCLQLKFAVRQWAKVEDSVLITGETGTGKELIAKALHGNRQGRFVPVNCAGFIANEALMESLLFGHAKGSFTGATTSYEGLVRYARNGTLFLDEVAELPLQVQSKLLRFLQEGTIRPLGSLEEVPVKTRLVCATKEPIEDLVKQGKFREDLYYRIAIGRLFIKPLRERPEDVTKILNHYFKGKIPSDFVVPDLSGNVRSLYIAYRQYCVTKFGI